MIKKPYVKAYLRIFSLLTLTILYNHSTATEATSETKRLPFEPEMVLLEGGTFQMGCASGKHCRSDELPVHEVTIQPFEIGKYEVTFDQWDEPIRLA